MKQAVLGFIRRILLLALLAVSVAGFGAWKYFCNWLDAPMMIPEAGIQYKLESGRSLGHLVRDFEAKGILIHPKALLLFARVSKKTKIRAGKYQVERGTTPRLLLDVLNRGDVIAYSVTLIEGWTFRQAVSVLSEREHLKSRLQGLTEAEQLAELDLPITHLEGWFFPDTYQFIDGATDVDILRRAYTKMNKTLAELWSGRQENLPYGSAYDALIMASIVERETGAPWEREKIAGVFVKRLGVGMRLQTDPTEIYGLGIEYEGNLTRADLKQATPYNTYVIKGLPPTPIALSGRDAIYASLHPVVTNDVYFVAKGDGTHVFSSTLDAHNRAVHQYQLKRRKDYRSSLSN